METPMVPDDRDRSFDKALARHLRPSAPDGPARIDRSQTSCPDAETLAAYHERLLSPEQMMSSKQHIAGCWRCQQIVAQLEATDELPLGVDLQEHQGQNVLNMPEPNPSAFAHATQAPVPAASRAAGAARVSRLRRVRPGANWRWLAPAGALAAGLLIWVAVHESSPPRFQIAKNQQPAAPPSSSAAVSRSAASINKEPASQDARDFSAAPRAGARAESGALAQNEGSQIERPRDERTQNQPGMLDKKNVAPLPAGKLTAPRRDLSDTLAPLDREANRTTIPGGFGAREKEKELKKQAPAAAPAPPPEEKDSSGAAQVVTLPPSRKSETPANTVASVSGRQAPQTQQMERLTAAASGVASELHDSSALRMVKARSSVTVTAPGATVLWRIALAGIIEHSTDAGSTWTVQTTGVITDLTAGSAPSDKVCWVVGRTGTILRTTDGGEHWLRVRAPIEDDLTAVFAIDAQQATVSSNKTYKTSDAGLTWALLPTP
jgi:hypothetical protein